jgi:hypothetical protein
LRQRGIEDLDVIGRGVRARVARAQQRGHRLPGASVAVIGKSQQRMEPKPAFIGRRGGLLL